MAHEKSSLCRTSLAIKRLAGKSKSQVSRSKRLSRNWPFRGQFVSQQISTMPKRKTEARGTKSYGEVSRGVNIVEAVRQSRKT